MRTCARASPRLGGIFDYETKAERLEEVSRELENPNVWDDPERAQNLGKERASLDKIVTGIRQLTEGLGGADELLQLADAESDEGTAQAVSDDVDKLSRHVESLEFQRMF